MVKSCMIPSQNPSSCTRRGFLRLCAGFLAFLGIGGKLRPAGAASRDALPFRFLRQMIPSDPATSRTMVWQADYLPKDTWLETQDSAGGAPLRTDASYTYFQQDNAVTYFFTASHTHLQPGHTYQYRIHWEEQAGSWHTLTTPRTDEPFQAVLINDSQCADYSVLAGNLQRIFSRHPDAAFLADLGDLTDNGQSEWHWQSFFGALGSIPARYPFVPVMGNHECYGLDWQMCLPERYLASLPSPDNDSSRFPGYYYSFDWGPVHFIVLNTQFLELDDLRPGLRTEELLWLKRDRAKSSRPWQVVLMHKDILAYDEFQPGTGQQGGISDVGHIFMPVFDLLGIDLVLSGHMHTYRNRGHLYGSKPADHGPVYILFGPSGDQHYSVPVDKNYDKVSCPQPTTDNYLTLAASKDTLHVEAHYVNGSLLDSVTLKK